jgi:hypothetical protein
MLTWACACAGPSKRDLAKLLEVEMVGDLSQDGELRQFMLDLPRNRRKVSPYQARLR